MSAERLTWYAKAGQGSNKTKSFSYNYTSLSDLGKISYEIFWLISVVNLIVYNNLDFFGEEVKSTASIEYVCWIFISQYSN